jgi:hypothetical protein
MNFTANDFTRLRWSLGFLLLAIVIGMLVTTATQKLVQKAKTTQRQLQAEQQQTRSRLARAADEERELRSKIALFQDLESRGVIGQEERLNWVEQIARIKTARRLLDVQYEISPQRTLADSILPGGSAAGGYEFVASAMKLQMPLLHEDDLLGFITDLRRSVHAHLLVRDCAIDRAASGSDRTASAQLRADCTIDWITLREKRQ